MNVTGEFVKDFSLVIDSKVGNRYYGKPSQ